MSQTAPIFQPATKYRHPFKARATTSHRTTPPPVIPEVKLIPEVKPVAACAADPEFISQMVKDCDQRVYRLALRITRNDHDAEDARQETMLKAYRHIDQFEGRARFTTWISRIAINEALMNLRKRNDGRHVPLEDVAEESEDIFALRQFRPPAENPESNFRRRELRASLDDAIRSLRPLYRDVFILRAIEERSTTETARALHLTVSTVKTRLRRARVELRDKLAKAWAAPQIPAVDGLEAFAAGQPN